MKYDLSKQFSIDACKSYLNKLIDKGALIEIKEKRLKRTIDQNALYWLWLSCIEKESGFKKEEIHILFRMKYAPKPIDYVTKMMPINTYEKIINVVNSFRFIKEFYDIVNLFSYSTTELDIPSFTEYLNQVKEYSREELDIYLLTLDDINFKEFYKAYIY